MSEQNITTTPINMVHHVHWDPMWYSSFQEYRVRLYRLMKKLLRILETNPDYGHFMFDGQVSAIEDYLEVAQEDGERIAQFVRGGRLAVGPWYVQPEEFLVSGESLVRNLQLGIKRAQELGGAMPVSYLCDPVGHIAQLPQILKGFGLDYFCAGRGIHDGDRITSSEFVWEASDGSEVLVQSMPIGYSHHLPADQEEFERDLARKMELIAPYNSTGFLFFAQGADHGEPMEEALAYTAEHNRRAGWRQISFMTLEAHMRQVDEQRRSLPRFRGELRHSRNMPMLTGILTTRMEVKLQNAAVQTGLEQWLEPFSAFHSMLGGEYPRPFIDLAWQYQIKNSFHDCIYGAHADHVTPDVMHGYKQASEIIAWKTNEALYGIAERAGRCTAERIVLFNPSGFDRVREAVDCKLFFPRDAVPRDFAILDANDDPVPFQVNGIANTARLADESGNVTGERWGGQGVEAHVTVLAPRIPALGYAVLYVRRQAASVPPTDLVAGETGCENSLIKVRINANGTLDVLDKSSGQRYSGLHFFEDCGDRGDQYNFSATVPEGIVTSKPLSARVTCESRGPVKAVYRVELDFMLPDGLDDTGAGRGEPFKTNSIITTVTVEAYSPVVRFHMTVDNRSRDHRLAVVFPTGIGTSFVDSGSQFGVNRRPVDPPVARDWREKPSGYWPHHRFFRVVGGSRGFAFLDRGLTEHRVTAGGDVTVTLLRCLGELSKDTLPERSFSHAGPDMSTPLAQELGRHEYDYTICLSPGLRVSETARLSAGFAAPARAMHLAGGRAAMGRLPDEMGLLRLAGDGAMLSAVKIGEDGRLVVRVYNASNEAAKAGLTFFRPVRSAELIDLMERPVAGLRPTGSLVELELAPFRIVTVAVELDENQDQ